ncbi:hypothetical protein D3C86_1567270 [compost metagenome]
MLSDDLAALARDCALDRPQAGFDAFVLEHVTDDCGVAAGRPHVQFGGELARFAVEPTGIGALLLLGLGAAP